MLSILSSDDRARVLFSTSGDTSMQHRILISLRARELRDIGVPCEKLIQVQEGENESNETDCAERTRDSRENRRFSLADTIALCRLCGLLGHPASSTSSVRNSHPHHTYLHPD